MSVDEWLRLTKMLDGKKSTMSQNRTADSDPFYTDRERKVVRTSIIAILANVGLAAMKAIVGTTANSVAILTDAINNLSDALSSIITIVGTKLGGKKADHDHPYGYGRIEFLTAMIISFIVLYAGITSLADSVKKIIHPEATSYSSLSLILLAIGVLVKIILGRSVKGTGEKINSDSLVASGSDALNDAILSSAVLVSAILQKTAGLSLEAWFGAVLSVFIVKSGIEMLKGTLDQILGGRSEAELSKQIKEAACEDPQVFGAYDLFLDSFGPDRWRGSLHVEVPENLSAHEIDVLERRVTANVLRKTGVILTGISIYSISLDPENTLKDDAARIVFSHENITQMHGFFADEEKKIMSFDIIVGWKEKDPDAVYQAVKKEVQEKYPEWKISIQRDTDMSD